jgi:hypothetical protein
VAKAGIAPKGPILVKKDISLQGKKVANVKRFGYLGRIMDSEGRLDAK